MKKYIVSTKIGTTEEREFLSKEAAIHFADLKSTTDWKWKGVYVRCEEVIWQEQF